MSVKPQGVGNRAKNRAATERAIIETAEQHLAKYGAAGLSLRKVARDVGMVPSALYRYFNGIDELYTTLIVRAFESQNAAAAKVAATLPTSMRWEQQVDNALEIAKAIRNWAHAHPHFYALIYGSPVPGYKAPDITIEPAAGVGKILLQQFYVEKTNGDRFQWEIMLEQKILPEPIVAFWSGMYGIISFELFGHLKGTIEDTEGFFERSIMRALEALRRELEEL
ncbi:TetR/AcrR family transcriptional regulator [Corynebacterium freiburgense]|uniref:TetR/AcrR family transcriptional regulator n=1 Tax=Corynebacterium freiburgense TaxID=556548 RepID=UPI00040DC038|nr:TetR/AcrR family transcriptional regulator [Corynebacterium freiburgense]